MPPSLTIVIIDSDVDAIKEMQKHIAKLGGSATVVGVAHTFDGGYELIHRKKPMLVIMEIGDDLEQAAERIQMVQGRFPQVAICGTSYDKSADTILSLMRAGMSEYLLRPVAEVDLVSALQKTGRLWLAKAEEEKEAGRVFSVFSPKGGVGCTTIALNLATNFYEMTRKPTLLVDLDLAAGDVATFLNIKPAYTLSDVTANLTRLDKNFLHGVITRHESGIHVLAEPQSVNESKAISCQDVKKILGLLKTMFPYVVLDNENVVNDCTLGSFELSDTVFIVLVLSLPIIHNTRKYLNYLNQIGIKKDKIKLIVNRHLKKGDITIEDAEKALKHPVSFMIPNEYEIAMTALNKGMPISSYSAKSKLNQSIRDIAASTIKAQT